MIEFVARIMDNSVTRLLKTINGVNQRDLVKFGEIYSKHTKDI